MQNIRQTIKQESLRAFLFASFLMLFISAYAFAAIGYPGTPPPGEISGGRFSDVLSRILQNGNYRTDTTGQVKDAAKLDGKPATDYQLRVTGSCVTGIQSIATNWVATCN